MQRSNRPSVKARRCAYGVGALSVLVGCAAAFLGLLAWVYDGYKEDVGSSPTDTSGLLAVAVVLALVAVLGAAVWAMLAREHDEPKDDGTDT